MSATSSKGPSKENKRRQDRRKAVLPVRVKGNDVFGEAFDELAHTLDVTPAGARLGGIRREVKMFDQLTVLFRKRKLEFRVVWTKKLGKASEYQVGLESLSQDGETWGMNIADFAVNSVPQPTAAVAQT